MATFNLTAEDSSPLISYAPPGAWSDSTDDPMLPSYSDNSLHSTSHQGATATINFTGTGIAIFGGQRSDYGTFSITVDGQSVASGSAASQQDAVKQLLGSASGLVNGPHTAVLTSTGNSPIDLDFVEIQTQVGSTGSQVTSKTVDDADTSISYQPPDAWQTTSADIFMDNTLHFTNSSGATASLSFTADAVAIWGTVSPDHANIRVSLDGQTHVFNAGSGGAVSALHTKTLLFFANDLGSGQQHTLVVSPDQEQDTGLFVDIDAVQLFSASLESETVGLSSQPATQTPFATSIPTQLPSSAPDRVGSSRKMSVASIASIVVGSLVAVLAIVTVVFLILRRRRRRARALIVPSSNEKTISSPKTPELPIQLENGYYPSPVRTDPVPPPMSYSKPVVHPPLFPKDNRSRASTFTISSYYTNSRHSRDGSVSMSDTSTTPMIPRDVPIVKVPRPPKARTRDLNGLPARPRQRPPALDLPD